MTDNRREPYFDGFQAVGAPGCTCAATAPTAPLYRAPDQHAPSCPHHGANFWRQEAEAYSKLAAELLAELPAVSPATGREDER